PGRRQHQPGPGQPGLEPGLVGRVVLAPAAEPLPRPRLPAAGQPERPLRRLHHRRRLRPLPGRRRAVDTGRGEPRQRGLRHLLQPDHRARPAELLHRPRPHRLADVAGAVLRDAVRPAARRLPQSPSPLRRWLRTLHLWIGLSVGVAFAMFGVSGTVLTYQPELLRWQHPGLFAQPVPDDDAIARGLARLIENPPPGVTGGDLPRAATPYWQLYTRDAGRLYMDAPATRVLLHRTPSNDWVLFLRDLHTHLLGGHTGEQVAGVLGLACLFLLVSGLYLWWPRFGGWWPQLRWFAQPPVRRWLSWHRSLGTLTLPLLLLVTLTGTFMVYGGAARSMLALVLPDAPDPAPPALPARNAADAATDWPA